MSDQGQSIRLERKSSFASFDLSSHRSSKTRHKHLTTCRRYSLTSHHTPPTLIINNLKFDDDNDSAHMSPVRVDRRSWSLNSLSHMRVEERSWLTVSSFFALSSLSSSPSQSNTRTDLYLYSLRNRTNTDVCSSIWRTQKLLDILYIHTCVHMYICCVPLRSL